MTTLKETALSMSRLTIGEISQSEISQSESNSSGSCYETAESDQSGTTQLESNDDEMGVFSCVELSGKDRDVIENKAGRPDVNKARPLAFDKPKDGVCTQCGRDLPDLAETLYNGSEGDHIHINENHGDIFINVGSQRNDHSTTSFLVEQKISHSHNPHPVNLSAQSAAKCLPVISSGSFQSSQNPRQNRRETNGAKRRLLHKTRLTDYFPRRKRSRRTINLKSASGQKIHVRDYNDADTRTVNLKVVNNMGIIHMGNNTNVTYCDGLPGRHTGGQLTADGVVADDDVILASPQRGPVFCTDKNIMKRLQQTVHTVTNEIYPLRDNGRWVEFHKEVDKKLQLAKEEKDYKIAMFMMIEKATALSYQGESDEALKMLKQARNMLLRRPNLGIFWKFLLVLLHCTLAAIYRRGNKLEKAYDALHIAKENVQFVPFDLAKVYMLYEMANWSLQSSYLCSSRDERDNYIEQAKTEFQDCFSLCERSGEEGVYVRRHHFCLVKKALLNLFCETTEARNQQVSEACIREAGDCITRMQQQYSEQMGASTAILLLAAQCDYYHRRGDHGKAENFAQQALLQAKNLGFQLEFEKLHDRCQHMSFLKQQD